MKGSTEIGVDDLPPVGEICLEERAHRHVGVVCHEDVDRTRRVAGLPHNILDSARIRHISRHRDPADLDRERGQRLGWLAIVDSDEGAVLGEAPGECCADALRRSGYEGDFSGERGRRHQITAPEFGLSVSPTQKEPSSTRKATHSATSSALASRPIGRVLR